MALGMALPFRCCCYCWSRVFISGLNVHAKGNAISKENFIDGTKWSAKIEKEEKNDFTRNIKVKRTSRAFKELLIMR